MSTGFHETNGLWHADDIPLPALAELAGTPTYIYSAARIRENIAALRAALERNLPPAQQPLIAYATKANSHQAVLKLCAASGCGADVVSGGELVRARTAGISADKIVFSGVGKSDDEIRLALREQIRQINVESGAELARIAALATETGQNITVALRLNPHVDAGTHEKITTGREDNKFGMNEGTVATLFADYKDHAHVKLRGLSLHIGSQLTNLEPFRAAFEKLALFTQRMRDAGHAVDTLDLGGGIGIVYENESAPCLDTYARIIKDTIAPLGTALILEPGRMIVGDAGLLLTRVMYVKEEAARRYIILDAGMNDLMRPALYDAFHAIRPVATKPDAPMHPYDIVGPVCETGDTFARNRIVPEVSHGDLVAIMTAGAYGAAMGNSYNSRPAPAEIMVDGDKMAIIRPRSTIQAIINDETIPDWLNGAV